MEKSVDFSILKDLLDTADKQAQHGQSELASNLCKMIGGSATSLLMLDRDTLEIRQAQELLTLASERFLELNPHGMSITCDIPLSGSEFGKHSSFRSHLRTLCHRPPQSKPSDLDL